MMTASRFQNSKKTLLFDKLEHQRQAIRNFLAEHHFQSLDSEYRMPQEK